jgi:triosephosphate isomerase
MHPENSGAFTGEISAQMLRHHFVTYVILGHSERRRLFGETDAFINQKVLSALKSNLKPIVCVGETLEERNHNRTLEVIKHQLTQCLDQVGEADADQLVIAYEPIWAIGTGATATPEAAQTIHEFVRSYLTERFGEKKAVKIRILYGGSVKAEITQDLLNQPDIDGVLVGGASLEVNSFVKIVQAATAQNQFPEAII